MTPKTKTAVLALVIAMALTVIKAAVGLLTMSISVLASALDSLMDIFSSAISLTAVSAAAKPADRAHPFGHGKAEAIAGFFQAILIASSAGFLIYHAFLRIVRGYQLEDEFVGVAVMIVATLTSIYLARHLKRVGRETQSTALAAGALNFGADVWTNIGVLIALCLERLAQVQNADPIISILISLYIIISAVRIMGDAITQLMDKTLPADVLSTIDRCIWAHGHCIQGYHGLRSRRVGAEKFIEFHLEIDRNVSFEHAHAITETIISDIKVAIPGSEVTVHSDPA